MGCCYRGKFLVEGFLHGKFRKSDHVHYHMGACISMIDAVLKYVFLHILSKVHIHDRHCTDILVPPQTLQSRWNQTHSQSDMRYNLGCMLSRTMLRLFLHSRTPETYYSPSYFFPPPFFFSQNTNKWGRKCMVSIEELPNAIIMRKCFLRS